MIYFYIPDHRHELAWKQSNKEVTTLEYLLPSFPVSRALYCLAENGCFAGASCAPPSGGLGFMVYFMA